MADPYIDDESVQYSSIRFRPVCSSALEITYNEVVYVRCCAFMSFTGATEFLLSLYCMARRQECCVFLFHRRLGGAEPPGFAVSRMSQQPQCVCAHDCSLVITEPPVGPQALHEIS